LRKAAKAESLRVHLAFKREVTPHSSETYSKGVKGSVIHATLFDVCTLRALSDDPTTSNNNHGPIRFSGNPNKHATYVLVRSSGQSTVASLPHKEPRYRSNEGASDTLEGALPTRWPFAGNVQTSNKVT
jgi:hypothetical protein